MSEEKRPQEETKRKTGKPVIIYIMILFIAAFLLMALSFLMHQRSNTEALGKLQDSVSAMQQIQESQEKIIELQDALADTEDALDKQQTQYKQDVTAAQDALKTAEATAKALEKLYCLQQEYASGDYAACKVIIEEMESEDMLDSLSSVPINTSNGAVTAPFVRFQQLKEAALRKLEESQIP